MAKQYDHKLKLLYLMQYLLEQSDEQHPISAEQIKASVSLSVSDTGRMQTYQNTIKSERGGIIP